MYYEKQMLRHIFKEGENKKSTNEVIVTHRMRVIETLYIVSVYIEQT